MDVLATIGIVIATLGVIALGGAILGAIVAALIGAWSH